MRDVLPECEQCVCDVESFEIKDEAGNNVRAQFRRVENWEEFQASISSWPDETRALTYATTWRSLAETAGDRIRVLTDENYGDMEALLLLPDLSGHGLLETAPHNRTHASPRRFRNCGRCLVARMLMCLLANGVSPIAFSTRSARDYYKRLGFIEVYPGYLVLDEDEAWVIISKMTWS